VSIILALSVPAYASGAAEVVCRLKRAENQFFEIASNFTPPNLPSSEATSPPYTISPSTPTALSLESRCAAAPLVGAAHDLARNKLRGLGRCHGAQPAHVSTPFASSRTARPLLSLVAKYIFEISRERGQAVRVEPNLRWFMHMGHWRPESTESLVCGRRLPHPGA